MCSGDEGVMEEIPRKVIHGCYSLRRGSMAQSCQLYVRSITNTTLTLVVYRIRNILISRWSEASSDMRDRRLRVNTRHSLRRSIDRDTVIRDMRQLLCRISDTN